MSRARTDSILPLNRTQAITIAAVALIAVIVTAFVVALPLLQQPSRYNQSGIQFFYQDEPVGVAVYAGAWTYGGELVDMAEFKIVWRVDVPEDSYVEITFRYGVWDGSSFEHTKPYTNQSRQGEKTVSYKLSNIDTTGLANGDVVIFGGEVEFAVYSADGSLLNSAGDRIFVRLVYDSGYTNEFILADITITPYDFVPDVTP